MDKAKGMFKNCLSEYSSLNTKLNSKAEKTVIAEQAPRARKALEKLDESSQRDWFGWWFGERKYKKILGDL